MQGKVSLRKAKLSSLKNMTYSWGFSNWVNDLDYLAIFTLKKEIYETSPYNIFSLELWLM